jgi:acyl-[acyl carrier protein]--UDP-N-acetylglucosamine O-acyltransferase
MEETLMLSPLAVVEPWVGLGEGCRVHHFAWIGKLPSSSPALARHPSSPHRALVAGRRDLYRWIEMRRAEINA